MKLAALGPRPVRLARRQQRRRGDPRHARARRALRAARLRALLAERAPRPADDRRQRARDPDGGDRRAHGDDPHRQRRRHAAALQRAQGRRAVPRARGARARTDRPRRRPRAGRRHADGARAQPECAAMAAEDFPVQVRDLQALDRARGRHAGITGASARAARARDLDPRQLRLRRAARRALRPAVRLRLFLHRRRRAPSRRSRSTARCTSRASAIPRRRRRCASGRSPPTSDEEAAHLALSRDRWRIDRARGVARAAAVAGRRSPRAASTPPRCRASRAMRARAFVGSAADGARADPQRWSRTFAARRGRDQHLGPRPGGAAHVVRAASPRRFGAHAAAGP